MLVVGGAKVEDKLGVLANLGRRADLVLVGGKMAAELAARPPLAGVRLVLPEDVVAAATFAPDAETRVVPAGAVPEGWVALDIGPATRARFADAIRTARTVFWNGPLGVFEWARFAEGTKAIAEAVAEVEGFSVVGGGDSARALRELGLAERVSWLSTGGGAELPGVVAIPEA
jgi:3-phosphoglycerate kinase